MTSREIEELVNQIIPLIDKLQPKRGCVPSEWNEVQSRLISMFDTTPSLANDSEIICSLAKFASKLANSKSLGFLTECISIGIGSTHTLWFALIALAYEKEKSYVSALRIFEAAKLKQAEPSAFLDLKFSDFKKRMTKRLQLTDSLELGVLDDVKYTFSNGTVISQTYDSNIPCAPQIDFLKSIGYTPTQNSAVSINMSNNTSKQEHYISGYSPNLLIGPDEMECSFEEQRLLFLGIDFIANRKVFENPDAISYIDQDEQATEEQPTEELVLPKKKRKPLQPISTSQRLKPMEESFSFNEIQQPRSILKKHESSLVASPRNNSKSISFAQNVLPQSPDRRRAPTPIPKRTLLPNETIILDNDIAVIEKQIGEHSYLAKGSKDSYVLKPFTIPLNFIPQHEELFALSIDQSPDFYITHFYNNGNLEKVLNMFHGKKQDQFVALFYLLQMILIIQDLEDKECYHGNIDEKSLMLRVSSTELAKTFSMNEKSWYETGLALIRCDKITPGKSKCDREAIYNLFINIALDQPFSGNKLACPRRWNDKIWNLAYNTLTSNDSLNPLQALILKELESNALVLRTKIARIISELLKANDEF
ncbi:hypothetical protein TRFO_31272 [Tritrichomonas foetus]|uniref:Protein kinase domain-containing protein n=1 Tax=Tritrichomonas foetus TaxID=1144522 RepID=A0A1J4JTK5_9EUKA|nr:hypothetical protein TRFO_31272 [Tritrichomonas foetus]|eukprot:OHT01760.1 hypothetical protein TRFO_31272 [Tritrichomonas foetus]